MIAFIRKHYILERGQNNCPAKYDTSLRLPLDGVFAMGKILQNLKLRNLKLQNLKLGSTLNVVSRLHFLID